MTDFKSLAISLVVEEAALRAVADVESQGDGFLPDGQVKILFEPHIFWRRLIIQGLKPEDYVKGNEDILYPNWQQGKYGKISEQHARQNRAIKINPTAALEAASYGAYQILATNWKSLGYTTVNDFVSAAQSDQGQVEIFTKFLKVNNLIPLLQKLDFNNFALRYNGSQAEKNQYPQKLKKAYDLWKIKLSKVHP